MAFDTFSGEGAYFSSVGASNPRAAAVAMAIINSMHSTGLETQQAQGSDIKMQAVAAVAGLKGGISLA